MQYATHKCLSILEIFFPLTAKRSLDSDKTLGDSLAFYVKHYSPYISEQIYGAFDLYVHNKYTRVHKSGSGVA